MIQNKDAAIEELKSQQTQLLQDKQTEINKLMDEHKETVNEKENT